MTHWDGMGRLFIANTILLLLRQSSAWAAGRKRKPCDKPTFCERTQLFVSYCFVLGRILMNTTKTIL